MVDSLSKFDSLLLSQEENLFTLRVTSFQHITYINKITKVYLENMVSPRMNYLHMKLINNIGVQVFVKEILIKIMNHVHHQLCCLCVFHNS
jgi:hypothetical protein